MRIIERKINNTQKYKDNDILNNKNFNVFEELKNRPKVKDMFGNYNYQRVCDSVGYRVIYFPVDKRLKLSSKYYY